MDDDQPRGPRAGRRARAAAFSADDGQAPGQEEEVGRSTGGGGGGGDQDGEGEGDQAPPPPPARQARAPPPPAADDDGDMPPPPPRRGGFGENDSAGPPPPRPAPDSEISDGTKYAGVSRRKQDQRRAEEEEKLKSKNKYDELVERAAPIDSILEIEEEGKEDLSGVVAEAPKVRINKVQNITDLDEDMQFRLPSTDDRDIDLSLLTSFLCSSEQVQEDDDIWDADMLFTNVASELHQEKERAEGITEKDGGKELEGVDHSL